MRLVALFFLLSVATLKAQDTYRVGVATTSGVSVKMDAQILISDSLYVFRSMGQETVKKLSSGSQFEKYVTDGTSIDKITISPMEGRLKGFTYNYVLHYQSDKRFTGSTVIYYCTKL